jgi:pyrroline-5-carboxylate reductase
MSYSIGILGVGNMGKAMLKGILSAGLAAPEQIIAYDSVPEVLESASAELGFHPASTELVVTAAEVILLAVKPIGVRKVLERIRPGVGSDKIVVSIAAGVTLADIARELDPSAKIVRVMPNTPALVLEGMAGLSPNENLTAADRETVLRIFRSFGQAELVSEQYMDAVVGVGGSGPAYVYLFIEALADGAVLCGMPRAQAYRFAAQMVLGSAKMVLETGQHPGYLKDMVCSPGGTTIEAVKTLEDNGFRSAVIAAVQAAAEKNSRLYGG